MINFVRIYITNILLFLNYILFQTIMGLEATRTEIHPQITADVKNLLMTRIGLDPLMSAEFGCQVYLQVATSGMGLHPLIGGDRNIKNGFTPFDML